MQIRMLDTENRRDVRRFVDLPFDLYRDCAQWVPPMVADVRGAMDRDKHFFYRRSAADFFLAEDGQQVLGRLSVMHHREFNEYFGSKTAFFSLFESVEDPEVAQGLFEAASGWARERGLDTMLGPKQFASPEPSGILVEGFEHRPALGMPYNLPYYDALVQGAGFEPVGDTLSGYISGDSDLSERFYRLADKVKERKGWWVKTFTSKKEMRSWVPRVIDVFQEAMREHDDFYPPTHDEAMRFANMLLTIADPRLIKLVMAGDEVIGFIFSYHDISAALQKARGRLWPLGWYYLLTERRRTEWVNVNGLGVLPAYQGRGASILLYTELAKSIKSFGFKHADVVAVGEQNLKSKSDMEAIGVQWYKRHRSYERGL